MMQLGRTREHSLDRSLQVPVPHAVLRHRRASMLPKSVYHIGVAAVVAWSMSASAAVGEELFTVGGAVYTELGNPLMSGLEGVEVCVDCDGGFSACTITEDSWGGWAIFGVPSDTCTVTPQMDGWCFRHVVSGEIGALPPLTIIVDDPAENLSIQFLASSGDASCCVENGDCEDGDSCTIDECFDGVCKSTSADCPPDFDCSGVVGPFDLATLLGAWGQCVEPCVPGDPATTCAADFNGDCEVGPFDLAVLLAAWGVCQ